MKRTIFTFAALALALMARAQGNGGSDVVLTLDFDSTVPVAEQMVTDKTTVDSLVLKGGPIGSQAMESVAELMRQKRVRGVDASQARFENDELPEEAFCLTRSDFRYITLPTTLKRLGIACLAESGIVELDVPEGVTELGYQSLMLCKKLRRLRLPSTLHRLGVSSLLGLESLQKLQLPEGLRHIDAEALAYLGSDVTSVVVPNSVDTIGEGAFFHCQGLQQVLLPQGLTDIADETFWGCTSLRQVEWPARLQSIGTRAFQRCDLRSVWLPEGVERIGAYAFSANYGLTEVVLPTSVQQLCASTFAHCNAMESLTCLAEVPPTVADDAVADAYPAPPTHATLYVPESSVEAYRSADYWKLFSSIEPASTLGIETVGTAKKHVDSTLFYRLDGRRAGSNHRGILLHKGRKYLFFPLGGH